MRNASGLFALVSVFSCLSCAAPDDETSTNKAPVAADEASAAAAPRGDCLVDTRMGGARTLLHFTDPLAPCMPTDPAFQAAAGRDFNIVHELKRLIDGVPAGGEIDGHIFQITMDSIAKALLEAQERGVSVTISTDWKLAQSTDGAKIEYLDKLKHIVYCTPSNGRACISSSTNASAISHVKLFTFKGTPTKGIKTPNGDEYQSATWFGSANQDYASGAATFNNAVTVYGWKWLDADLQKYLGDLYAQRQYAQYYDPALGRGYYPHQPADFFLSPSPDTDIVVDQLDQVTPDQHCRVRAMQASIADSRMDVVDKLVSMKKGGCFVEVAANDVGTKALAALKAAKIPVHENVIHDKSFLIYGTYGGVRQYRVYTGSHNILWSSNYANDELFARLAAEPDSDDASTRPVYNAYFRHFYDAFTPGKPF